jgi:hypothetical protein
VALWVVLWPCGRCMVVCDSIMQQKSSCGVELCQGQVPFANSGIAELE